MSTPYPYVLSVVFLKGQFDRPCVTVGITSGILFLTVFSFMRRLDYLMVFTLSCFLPNGSPTNQPVAAGLYQLVDGLTLTSQQNIILLDNLTGLLLQNSITGTAASARRGDAGSHSHPCFQVASSH
jgi:hypothetical protein